jgi:hypothetical protein
MVNKIMGAFAAGAILFTGVPAFASGGSGGSGGSTPTTTVACDTVASYKQSSSVASGLSMFKATISLADPCDKSTLSSILVWARDENTGALNTMFAGGYNKAYTFSSQIIATPGHVYTIVVNTFRTVNGVTTYVQTELPSVLAINYNTGGSL